MLYMCAKHKTVLLYLVFGGITSLVNIVSYFAITRVLGSHYLLANTIAWVAAVSFAYVSNRACVFASQQRDVRGVLGECSAFFACRLFSGLLDTSGMYILITLLQGYDALAKILLNGFVIALNYILSKQIVFRKGSPDEAGLI